MQWSGCEFLLCVGIGRLEQATGLDSGSPGAVDLFIWCVAPRKSRMTWEVSRDRPPLTTSEQVASLRSGPCSVQFVVFLAGCDSQLTACAADWSLKNIFCLLCNSWGWNCCPWQLHTQLKGTGCVVKLTVAQLVKKFFAAVESEIHSRVFQSSHAVGPWTEALDSYPHLIISQVLFAFVCYPATNFVHIYSVLFAITFHPLWCNHTNKCNLCVLLLSLSWVWIFSSVLCSVTLSGCVLPSQWCQVHSLHQMARDLKNDIVSVSVCWHHW